jgi:glycosyltransferase involved in cell wall biosynthesis
MNDILFITWFSHRRTTELCEYFKIPLIELISIHKGLRRYFELSVRTLIILAKKKPKILIVQNPSIILALLALFLKKIFRYYLIIDAHNEAVEPYSNKFPLIRWSAKLLLRHADQTIVTNRHIAKTVDLNRGKALILPDRIPRIPSNIKLFEVSDKFNVAVIATFAKDEPIDRIIFAAKALDDKFHFYFTGNEKKLSHNLKDLGTNSITFCGFLPEPNYWGLLKACDIVLDLTLKDNCLVCGAYEAIAVGTPVILSENPACVELFGKIAIFSDNSTSSIQSVLMNSLFNINKLRLQIATEKESLEKSWLENANILCALLEKLSGHKIKSNY